MSEKKKSTDPASKIKKKKIISVAVTLVLFVTASFLLSGSKYKVVQKIYNTKNSVYFLDCGQGDCSLIISNGKATLVDCGTSENAESVINNLKRLKIKSIENIIFSHSHSDHIGGAFDIINRFKTNNIYFRKQDFDKSTIPEYYALKKKIQETKTKIIDIKDKMQISFEDFKFSFYIPSLSAEDENDMSAVLFAVCQNISFLFTGDISTKCENKLLDVIAHCDVLKVPHHGSKNSNDENFLKTISPRYAVISCGIENGFRHPSGKALNVFSELKINLLRTDFNGNIGFFINNNNIEVSAQKEI